MQKLQKHTWRLLAAASLSAPFFAACGRGDDATNDSAGGTVAMTDSTGISTQGTMNETAAGAMDPSMVTFVATVNQSEIEAGRLAQTKARNGDVKDYAKMMVDEHEDAMKELQDLSTRSGWTMPTGSGTAAGGGTMDTGTSNATQGGSMTGAGAAAQGDAGGMMSNTLTQMQQSHTAAMTKLRSSTGAEFDRAYMDSQVAAHQQTLDVLRQHANAVQNSELRTKVSDMQKEVEEHLRKAQDIAQKLGGTRG